MAVLADLLKQTLKSGAEFSIFRIERTSESLTMVDGGELRRIGHFNPLAKLVHLAEEGFVIFEAIA